MGVVAVNGRVPGFFLPPGGYPYTAEEEAILAAERLEPCTCGHPMGVHDEDDRCTLCSCTEFEYKDG